MNWAEGGGGFEPYDWNTNTRSDLVVGDFDEVASFEAWELLVGIGWYLAQKKVNQNTCVVSSCLTICFSQAWFKFALSKLRFAL